MRAAHIADIETPKGYVLNGIWFGTHKPRTVYILVHGLGGHMLNSVSRSFAEALISPGVAVLSFNNRGSHIVSKLYKSAPKTKRGYKRYVAGSAMEIFEDCVDDIEGVVRYAKARGAKNIFLVGHSTGCQKSVYWAAKKKGRGVRGVILLAPVSDYAAMLHMVSAATYAAARRAAALLLKQRKPNQLLPQTVWPELISARRFMSLYGATSAEEIFPYWSAKLVPRALRSTKIPVFAVLAEKDEYWDRPVRMVAEWFLRHLHEGEVEIIPDAGHSFKGAEPEVARKIRRWARHYT